MAVSVTARRPDSRGDTFPQARKDPGGRQTGPSGGETSPGTANGRRDRREGRKGGGQATGSPNGGRGNRRGAKGCKRETGEWETGGPLSERSRRSGPGTETREEAGREKNRVRWRAPDLQGTAERVPGRPGGSWGVGAENGRAAKGGGPKRTKPPARTEDRDTGRRWKGDGPGGVHHTGRAGNGWEGPGRGGQAGHGGRRKRGGRQTGASNARPTKPPRSTRNMGCFVAGCRQILLGQSYHLFSSACHPLSMNTSRLRNVRDPRVAQLIFSATSQVRFRKKEPPI